jgi:hypothetical protein
MTTLSFDCNQIEPKSSIEDLTREVEGLKQKLEDERAKFNDVERNS